MNEKEMTWEDLKQEAIQSKLDNLKSKLKKLDSYECDCPHQVYKTESGHSPTCSLVIAGEIRKQLLISKMENEIIL